MGALAAGAIRGVRAGEGEHLMSAVKYAGTEFGCNGDGRAAATDEGPSSRASSPDEAQTRRQGGWMIPVAQLGRGAVRAFLS